MNFKRIEIDFIENGIFTIFIYLVIDIVINYKWFINHSSRRIMYIWKKLNLDLPVSVS